MRKILGCLLFLSVHVYSQAPPPLGLTPFFAIDYDNDGFGEFDIPTAMESFWIPSFESFFGQSLAGYDMTVIYEDQPIGPLYTNVIPVEQFDVWIQFEYNGNGPEYVPVFPWIFPIDSHGGLKLVTLPHDEDYDGDGISNKDEDDNNNGNVYDDDIDNNGQFDVWSPQEPLGVAQSNTVDFSIFPNPSNDVITINFRGNMPQNSSLEIYSANGKLLMKPFNVTETIDVSSLASGIYFVKLRFEDMVVVKKLVLL